MAREKLESNEFGTRLASKRRASSDLMNDLRHSAKVIELFEKYRAAPGEPYDESHFLDYLLRSPAKPRAVYDSFGGLRRFNAFIDDVQMEFAICLSLQDRDANYSLAKFLQRVAELEKSPRGSLASLANQEKAGAGWQFVVIAAMSVTD
jgi:hypothetical protein